MEVEENRGVNTVVVQSREGVQWVGLEECCGEEGRYRVVGGSGGVKVEIGGCRC